MREKSFLVIGLGSMGQRRIKHLLELGVKDISVMDRVTDIEIHTAEAFSVERSMRSVEYDVKFICTPPDDHRVYFDKYSHMFIEHMTGMINDKIPHGTMVAPSCSFLFHPAYKIMKKVLLSDELGEVKNVIYHSGKALQDWRKGGAPGYVDTHYMLVFEMMWLTHLFGMPIDKRFQVNDGVINTILELPGTVATLSIDIVSRKHSRRLLVVGTEKNMLCDFYSGYVSVYDPVYNRPECFPFDMDLEKIYFNETKAFLDAVDGGADFPNTMEHTNKVIELCEVVK